MEEIGGTRTINKNSERLSYSIPNETASGTAKAGETLQYHSTIFGDGHGHSKFVKTRNFRACPPDSEFRIKYVSDSQKRRNLPSNFQFKKFKQLFDHKQVSFDFGKSGSRFYSGQGLDGQNRPQASLQPRKCCTSTSVFSPSIVSKSVTANDLFAIWPGDSAQSVCIADQLDRRDFQESRHTSSGFSRRLSFSSTGQNDTYKTRGHCSSNPQPVGLAGKQGEVDSCPSESNRVFGFDVGSVAKSKIFTRKQNSEHANSFIEVAPPAEGVSSRDTEYHRGSEFCSSGSSNGSFEFSPSTGLLQLGPENAMSVDLPLACGSTERVELVEASLSRKVQASSTTSEKLFDHGCSRFRLGGGVEWSSFIGQVDKRRRAASFESQRDANHFKMFVRVRSVSESYISPTAVRQQGGGGVLEKGRRKQVEDPDGVNISNISFISEVRHSCNPPSHTRQVQQCRRWSISSFDVTGMASAPRIHQHCLCKVGCSPDRSFCLQHSSRSALLCHSRSTRPASMETQRVLVQLGFSSGLGLSSSEFVTPGPDASQSSSRCIPDSCTEVVPSILESRLEDQSDRTSVHDSPIIESASGHEDRAATTSGEGAGLRSMEMWGWSESLGDWSAEQKCLLKQGWRSSTLNTYRPAWQRWLNWCSKFGVNFSDPSGSELARYLADLHLKEKLSYRTILLHKSVVSTLCNTKIEARLSSNILVKQMIKAIALQQPKKCPPTVWDPQSLVGWLGNRSLQNQSLFDISRVSAVLLLLCSGRRIHDLTLLSVSPDRCIVDQNSIMFWPHFGSKTDSETHVQSGWRLLGNVENEALDPVVWLKKLIEIGKSRRLLCSSDRLFITVCGKARPATKTILAGWVKSILKEAGIQATPGSFRSAVASRSWLDNEPLDEIMARANWRSGNTFKKHYRREVVPAQGSSLIHLFQPIN